MLLSLVSTIAAACVFAEFVGYWLHVLLHSEKIPFLSRNHLLHHLVVYARSRRAGPSREALDSAYDPAARFFMGFEWLLPVSAIMFLALIAMRLLEVPAALQIAFIAASLAWGLIMFDYLHDAMHDEEFWMTRSPFWRERFLRARRLHDIHHADIVAAGRSSRNYGVFFFGFDRLFGTFAENARLFGREELKAAFKRYLEICSSAV